MKTASGSDCRDQMSAARNHFFSKRGEGKGKEKEGGGKRGKKG